MRVFLNGQEMQFVEGGYEFVFIKPYQKFVQDTIKKGAGIELHIQLYDNGVQIRTLVSEKEVSTLINRNVSIDSLNNKIYILEENTKFKQNDDSSVEILKEDN